jgi:hypothetical protein
MPAYERITYTDTECISLEQRILQDALFIQGGARIDSHGRLVITQAQLEQEQQSRLANAGVSKTEATHHYPAHEAIDSDAREQWLNTSVEAHIPGRQQPSLQLPSLTRNALYRDSILTVRALHVVGRESLEEVWSIGKRAIALIDKALEPDAQYGLVWKNRPTMDDIVSLTHDLGQVPSFVLCHRKDLLKTTGWISYDDRRRGSVQEVLDRPYPVDREGTAADQEVLRREQSLRAAAEEFAAKYAIVKRRLQSEIGQTAELRSH